jgi:S-adenosylmethionine hydrolase
LQKYLPLSTPNADAHKKTCATAYPAAHLSNGVSFDEFGSSIDVNNLVEAVYDEAMVIDNLVYATVIQINHFGSVHLNIKHELWSKLE